ncbi:uncharacterized protein LOC113231775 [Hyposmocoma kahamanoa]|uniref:uncharacterized protein LOC113231775 n=1 Tax=Hyposmocoma kahamanoa TaxID=1477025 RepID=UPI000E6D830C|nr:uncharacterized protein LOC113231775 [Hyposmocoma kahamanoa]
MSATVFIFLVTVQCMHLAQTASHTKRSYEDPTPIIYPGPVQIPTNRYSDDVNTKSDSEPEECKGKNYCTIKPPDYPEQQFNEMFKGYKPIPQPTLLADDTPDRQGDPSEVDDCDTTVTYEPLYKVRSVRGDIRTVIQAPKHDFVQRVRLEECKSRNTKCFKEFPDIGIETFCKQKYNTWEVLVSDGKGGSEKIKTHLPVCCSCNYRI